MTRPHTHEAHGHKPASFHGSPAQAQQAPPEEYLYVVAMRAGAGVEAPDFFAVIDTDAESDTHGQVVHETPMPYIGDDLHPFGYGRDRGRGHTQADLVRCGGDPQRGLAIGGQTITRDDVEALAPGSEMQP